MTIADKLAEIQGYLCYDVLVNTHVAEAAEKMAAEMRPKIGAETDIDAKRELIGEESGYRAAANEKWERVGQLYRAIEDITRTIRLVKKTATADGTTEADDGDLHTVVTESVAQTADSEQGRQGR